MKIGFIICILILGVKGCDPVTVLPTDGSEEKNIDFPCGKVTILVTKSLGPGYIISHEFNLNKEITLFFDSLQIIYHNKLLLYEILDAQTGNLITDKNLTLNEKRIINLDIDENLQPGDSLFVQMQGFMICEGMSVYDDKLTIILEDHP
ncbi:MAG: hypothetical protein HC819_10405 [Cyclobacteriaceae bacterium]|nr:hypothetical protein [Cyclobacteriaceae bacterium]